MHISASGFINSDIYNIIEKIADNKARQYKKIAYLDADDIKQEVRIKCVNALRKYEEKREDADLFVFLSVCADNKLRDIKRNILYKHNGKICQTCNSINGKFCNKCKKLQRNVHSKMSLGMPISLEDQGVESKLYDACSTLDILDYIKFHLPSGLYKTFDKFQEANFNFKLLKQKERVSISGVIISIINNFYKE